MRPEMQKKAIIVKEILEKVKNSKSMVVAEYHNLTVKQLDDLKNQLREKNVELKVYKNNLVSLAVKEAGFSELDPFLVGPNAFAFGIEEEITPAKILAKFAKKNPALKLKAGIYGQAVLDTASIIEIASLPTKEELIAKFMSLLQYPLRKFAVLCDEIAKKQATA